jgi:hypothetical protein
MPIHHDTNAMQNARPNYDTYATKELPPPTQETKQTPSSPHKRVKVA